MRERMEEGRMYGFDDMVYFGMFGFMESDRYVVWSIDIVNCIFIDVSFKRFICGGKDLKDLLRIFMLRFWVKSLSWVSVLFWVLLGVEMFIVIDLVWILYLFFDYLFCN